jgi:hypothetical protein
MSAVVISIPSSGHWLLDQACRPQARDRETPHDVRGAANLALGNALDRLPDVSREANPDRAVTTLALSICVAHFHLETNGHYRQTNHTNEKCPEQSAKTSTGTCSGILFFHI